MTDTSKERCEEIARRLRTDDLNLPIDDLVVDAANLITALCERVTELEWERDSYRNTANQWDARAARSERMCEAAEAALAATLSETDAIIEPFARFVNPSPQGAWDGPNIAMGDFQRADKYRRKRIEQTGYKGDADE